VAAPQDENQAGANLAGEPAQGRGGILRGPEEDRGRREGLVPLPDAPYRPGEHEGPLLDQPLRANRRTFVGRKAHWAGKRLAGK